MCAFHQSCPFPALTPGGSKGCGVGWGGGEVKKRCPRSRPCPSPFMSLNGSRVDPRERGGGEHKIACKTKGLNWIKLVWNCYALKWHTNNKVCGRCHQKPWRSFSIALLKAVIGEKSNHYSLHLIELPLFSKLGISISKWLFQNVCVPDGREFSLYDLRSKGWISCLILIASLLYEERKCWEMKK